MFECPNCGAILEDEWEICPECDCLLDVNESWVGEEF